MEVKERKLENASRELTITVPVEEITAQFEKEYQKIQKQASVDGFRKGKAPIDVVKKKFVDTAKSNVAESLIRENYVKALEELKISPIDHPKVDFEAFTEDAPFTFTALLEVYPTVELKEYTGISVEETQVKVTDKDVMKEIDGLRERNAQIHPKEDGDVVEEGNLVKARTRMLKEGEEAPEGGYSEITVIADKNKETYEFDTHVMGMKKGDEKEVVISYPDDYNVQAIAGTSNKYQLIVDEVSRRELPAADDEFAKDLEKYETFAELKDDTKSNLEKYTSERARSEAKSEIIDKIVEKAMFDIPKTMIEREKGAIFNRMKQRYNLNIDDPKMFAALMGMNEEDFDKKLLEEASKSIKTTLTLSEISTKEKLEVPNEDYDKKLEELAAQYNQSVEEITKSLETSGMKQNLLSDMLFDKTIDFLYENAKVKKGKSMKVEDFLNKAN